MGKTGPVNKDERMNATGLKTAQVASGPKALQGNKEAEPAQLAPE